MPILPAEPDMYPPDLWVNGAARTNGLSRWWCLHAKPRQEKAAARQLRTLRIAHYLPQVTHESHTPGGRKIRSVIPLFPGYLFLLGDEHHRLAALHTNHLVNVLEVSDQAQIAGDLRQIQQLVDSGLPVVPEPTYPVGARIRIMSGPLNGIVGTVVRRGKRDQFVAVVHFLGRGATVDLQDWQVEGVD
ncbi:MAG TPA: transcription termination/antitermination NusG family protein [Isosphaeraceae bacterium]|nr:transcription termination/antitermination NusG family protein [Isosphaeraceae bacterium]